MARIKVIITTRRAWTLLVVLALLAFVVQSAAFSGASFTAATTNQASFSAGTVRLTNDHDGQVIINSTYLRPGESSPVVTVNLTNAGTLTGPLTLSVGSVTDTPASPAFFTVLHLVVVDNVSGTTLYNGPISGLGTRTLATLSPGQAHAYRLNLLFDAPDADPALQSCATTVVLLFTLSS
jgi:hypothetical protein